ncbi:hypothetical protein [Mesorhizobium sp. NBSH29]|nr:hypothetical protein [Mesorhizobium sp. NBSH29]
MMKGAVIVAARVFVFTLALLLAWMGAFDAATFVMTALIYERLQP